MTWTCVVVGLGVIGVFLAGLVTGVILEHREAEAHARFVNTPPWERP